MAREMYGNPCQQQIASLREWAKKEEPRKDDDDDDEDEPNLPGAANNWRVDKGNS